jgi:hypothetical protein
MSSEWQKHAHTHPGCEPLLSPDAEGSQIFCGSESHEELAKNASFFLGPSFSYPGPVTVSPVRRLRIYIFNKLFFFFLLLLQFWDLVLI